MEYTFKFRSLFVCDCVSVRSNVSLLVWTGAGGSGSRVDVLIKTRGVTGGGGTLLLITLALVCPSVHSTYTATLTTLAIILSLFCPPRGAVGAMVEG